MEHEVEILIHQIEEGDLENLVIDSCEYIAFKDGKGINRGFGYLALKGKCHNPVHCHNDIRNADSTNMDLNN